MSFQELQENEDVYNKWVPEELQKKVKAVFIAHSHYDHILDLSTSVKNNNAIIYGSESAMKIAKSKNISPHRLKKLSVDKEYSIDKYKVKVLGGKHPSHLLGLTIAEGSVDNPQDIGSALSYKMGEVYTFLIEVSGKRIFIASSGYPVWKTDENKVDIIIQGIANKKHYLELVDKQVKASGAKIVIPIHFDNFFRPVDKELTSLFFANVEMFQKLMGKNQKLIIPQIGKPIIVEKE